MFTPTKVNSHPYALSLHPEHPGAPGVRGSEHYVGRVYKNSSGSPAPFPAPEGPLLFAKTYVLGKRSGDGVKICNSMAEGGYFLYAPILRFKGDVKILTNTDDVFSISGVSPRAYRNFTKELRSLDEDTYRDTSRNFETVKVKLYDPRKRELILSFTDGMLETFDGSDGKEYVHARRLFTSPDFVSLMDLFLPLLERKFVKSTARSSDPVWAAPIA